MKDFDSIISAVRTLPPLPGAVQNLCKLTENLNSNINEISNVIAVDEALTSKLLRMVNSAFYGLSQQITTVSRAVVVLGFAQVRNLALSLSVLGMKNAKADNSERRERLWKHALAVATIGRMLARKRVTAHMEEVFTAGLLHDLGKLVAIDQMAEEYADICRQTEIGKQALYAAEAEQWGMDHAGLGALACENWKLPELLREAIANHHAVLPELPSPLPVSALIQLCDQFSKVFGCADDGDPYLEPGPLSVWPIDQLQAAVAQVAVRIDEEFKLVESLFGISAGRWELPEYKPTVGVLLQDVALRKCFSVLLASRGWSCVTLADASALGQCVLVLHDEHADSQILSGLSNLKPLTVLQEESVLRPAGVQVEKFWQWCRQTIPGT